MASNQSYRAGEAKAQAEEKTGQMMNKTRQTKEQAASYVSDKAAQMGQSTKETAEAGKGVMQRTTEQVKIMAQGAADKVKETFGMAGSGEDDEEEFGGAAATTTTTTAARRNGNY